MKNIIKIFFLALATVIVIVVLAKLNFDSVIEKPNSTESDKITLQIDSGETTNSIIEKLVDSGILKKNWVNYFKVYLKLNDLSSKIQAGTYEIPKNLNIKEIAETIQKAKGLDIWVTIQEGLRKDEIAKILSSELAKGGNTAFDENEFLNLTTDTSFISTLGFKYELEDLEGFLFPDKYAFSVESNSNEVLLKMINNFQTKVGLDDTYDDIIISSMVEREGRNAQDRPMIADIIKRRYAEGWLLQLCATVLYEKKDWEHVITTEDMQENAKYNTYKNPGLTPTPICNPGLEAINAVRNPQANDYYYFIHDPEGNVHYGKNLTEHNNNVAKYLR